MPEALSRKGGWSEVITIEKRLMATSTAVEWWQIAPTHILAWKSRAFLRAQASLALLTHQFLHFSSLLWVVFFHPLPSNGDHRFAWAQMEPAEFRAFFCLFFLCCTLMFSVWVIGWEKLSRSTKRKRRRRTQWAISHAIPIALFHILSHTQYSCARLPVELVFLTRQEN